MPDLKTGDHAPLNVTKEARHRIFVGLGWDPNEKTGLKDKIGDLLKRRDGHHDLDLSCFYYGADRACLGVISPQSGVYADASETIYHSGDNAEGVGDGDDEQISVELKDLPDHIHHLIFKASIKSGHRFGEVDTPEIRICDGYSGHCFLQTALQDHAKDADAYVFLRLYRRGAQGWGLHYIDSACDNLSLEDWKEALKSHISK
ncbi:MAG: TerD family protein [Bdellovibrionales bacterium]